MAAKPRRTVTASELRANVYELLDGVLETGAPLRVERKGRALQIIAEVPRAKLDRLKRRPGFVRGDAGELVHLDWSSEWKV